MSKSKSTQPSVVKKVTRNVKNMTKKSIEKMKTNAESGARRAVTEQLFYDFNKSKSQVYWVNFFRGIFFGVGSVIGGTLVVAIIVSVLSFLTDVPGVFGEFIQYIVDVVKRG